MANNVIKIKRTAVSGRTPNVTSIANTSYISAGELALNMADGVLYSSNGSALIAIGAQQDAISATSVSASSLNANNVTVDQGISVGNSTVNTSINAVAIFSGNASVNALVNTTMISVSNSTSNSTIRPTKIFTGNNAANVTIEVRAGASNLAIATANVTSAGLVTIQTVANHGITLEPGLTANIVGSSVAFFNSSNYANPFKITSIPSVNTFTFSVTPSEYSNSSRRISTITRTNGVVTVVTIGNHGLLTGDTIFISDNITGTLFSFNTTGSTITKVNDTTFTYTNQSADSSFSLSGVSYSIPLVPTSASNIDLIINKSSTGFSVGDRIRFTSPNPSSFTSITKITLSTTSTIPVKAANSTSFTVTIGTRSGSKTFGPISGSFSSGTVTRSFNEGPFRTSAAVGQVIGTTSIGGNTSIYIPLGVSINQGDLVVKITDTFIYVGNTTLGTIFDSKGTRAQKGL